MEKPITVDVVIFGGGIAGLWLLNRLRHAGYQAILLETNALGSGQTLKSQGIIHGGLKYALTGFLSGSTHAVELMPQHWKNCLAGRGEIDLQSVKILSQEQLLWSTGGLGSEIASFFASKALSSRVKKLQKNDYPTLLQNASFKGHVYRLEEVILNTVSLIEALAKPHRSSLLKINPDAGFEFHTAPNAPEQITSITVQSESKRFSIAAKSYIFAAGEGNEQLTQSLKKPAKMQRRPLQMVCVKLDHAYPFFAHCIDTGMNPRVTITTHTTQAGKAVWYIGGQIAEDGIHRTKAEQIKAAQSEMTALLPWIDLKNAQWETFFINRAEAAQPGHKRPDSFSMEVVGNTCTIWPTKLALSPLLADTIAAQLKQQNIHPTSASESLLQLESAEKPEIAKPFWDTIF